MAPSEQIARNADARGVAKWDRREIGCLALLVLVGLAARLAWSTAFPAVPVSDFRAMIVFAQALRDHGIAAGGWFWMFNPGLPLVLAGLFRMFPHADPDTVARLATVCASGLLGCIPFLVWRGVLPLWTRLLAGSLLALWPGQILFSGVVAQDTWAMFPTVALGAVAVRALFSGKGAPVAAGLLYGAAALVRQEMPLPLLPLFLAAAGVRPRLGWRRAVVIALCGAVPLLAIAAQRYAATGRFALSQETSGIVILGSYVPGAAAAGGWLDPSSHIASVQPELLRNRRGVLTESSKLALAEVRRRPGFHALRLLSTLISRAADTDSSAEYWSLGSPDVLPPALRGPGGALFYRLGRPLLWEMILIHAFFGAAMIFGVWKRHSGILVLAFAALLKYAVHVVTIGSAGRYFFSATALELLAIAVAAYELRAGAGRKRLFAAGGVLVIMIASTAAALTNAPQLEARVVAQDRPEQRRYRFVVETNDRNAALSCQVDRGTLVSLNPTPAPNINAIGNGVFAATVRTLDADPVPGEVAEAVCDLTVSAGRPRLALEILDPYAPGGLPGRMVQRVEVDGREVYSHDMAEAPGAGWTGVPLGPVAQGTHHKVSVEVKAVRPDPGCAWGAATPTQFRLATLP